ncbi:DNA-directed RNA polymerase II subunit RPB1-like isoform X1 [Daphnia pulicaria]|uniref:DNA-directed RNA polymerase II subunit RPB1-like isoform X1 n=1 Tax=Daphnia pulicaria TaxID=35523 RepID=UPI001EECB554|nr:DNA-directed RNA polymerase II subunit RPB1-like isoform X1 [Daphnia pulicaria]
MHFLVHSVSLLIAVAVSCVNSVPYGFGNNAGRVEDAVVVDAAPSFSPVDSDSTYPVHSPGMFCRHKVYYSPSESEPKQNYKQKEQVTYETYLPSPEFVRIRSYAPSSDSETFRAPSSYEPQRTPSTSYNSNYETSRTPSNSYNTNYETQRAPSTSYNSNYETHRTAPSYSTNYETYQAPSASVESPQYFQRQNNEIQENSHIRQFDQTGSMYESFMVQVMDKGYPSARTVMGYRLMNAQEPKSSLSYN